MRVVLFCHSLMSDWNNRHAHFLRGIATELQARGHEVTAYEPVNGWSRTQLLAHAGADAEERFRQAFPTLDVVAFDLHLLSLEDALYDADLVLVHEWTDPKVVERIGRHKAKRGRYVLLFHDTHHRSAANADDIAGYDLQHYDGVLAFGEVIREQYLRRGWSRRVWTWHEAADIRVFHPRTPPDQRRHVIWIGNWGDGERSTEITNYIINPVRELALTATVYGVRYPEAARRALKAAGIDYKGWLPNDETPKAYAAHQFTVHIPRHSELPGIPAIRVFEALACGVPLVIPEWRDVEGLFSPGLDYLVAQNPTDMRDWCTALSADASLRRALAQHGLDTIRRRHTCAHRVDELLAVFHHLRGRPQPEVMSV